MTLDCSYTYVSSSSAQIASSSCEAGSSSVPLVSGGFTYGELVSSTLLLLIFSVVLYWFFTGTVRGHKIHT